MLKISIYFKFFTLIIISIIIISCDKTPQERNLDALQEFAEGDTLEAIQMLSKIIEECPDFREAKLSKAKINSIYQNYEDAYFNYSKLIESDPKDLEALKGRALILLKQNKYEEALKDLNTAITINKDDKDLLSLRAYAFFEIDLLLMACEDWQLASELGDVKSMELFQTYCKKLDE